MSRDSSLIDTIIFIIIEVVLLFLLGFLWNTKNSIEEENNYCYINYSDSAFHTDDCMKAYISEYDEVTIKKAKELDKSECSFCFDIPLEGTFTSGLLEVASSFVLIIMIGVLVVYFK